MRETREEKTGGRRGGRLKGVRKRKHAQREFECEVMALKLRLVKTQSRRRQG
ncbi:MAG: hypothetical protein IMY86_09810 [Chloroflexi bacterium]|nr:hypothetical protein [Chloroflexota bacterium]